MLAPLLALAVAAAPGTGLTLSAQMGKASTPVATYLDAIEQELLANQVPVRRLPLLCDGARDCLLNGAKAASLKGLVAVTIAYAKKQTTLDVEGLRVSDGTTIAQLTFTASGRLSEANRADLKKFAQQLSVALAEEKKDAPVVDKPVTKPTLTAEVKQDVELKVTPEPAARPKTAAWVIGGVGAGSAIASGIFLGLASGARGELESTPNPSPLTRTQADALAAQANTDYTVSLATGIAAGALITTAIVLLVSK